MISTKEGYTRSEYFSSIAAADSRRKEFDIKNWRAIIGRDWSRSPMMRF